MSDKLFFHIDIKNISDGKFQLDKLESYHFIKVLRKNINSEIWLTDGIGTVYRSNVDSIDKNLVSGLIIQEIPNYGENKNKINLGIGILKKDKMEFVVEKSTECGINEIFPIVMDRCIKRDVNIKRLNKIAFTSVKQCGRSRIPKIDNTIKFNEFLDESSDPILVFTETGLSIDANLQNKVKNSKVINILIGPEGDYSDNEIELLKSKNAIFLNLGNRRLRSETAVITALSQINLIINS